MLEERRKEEDIEKTMYRHGLHFEVLEIKKRMKFS